MIADKKQAETIIKILKVINEAGFDNAVEIFGILETVKLECFLTMKKEENKTDGQTN